MISRMMLNEENGTRCVDTMLIGSNVLVIHLSLIVSFLYWIRWRYVLKKTNQRTIKRSSEKQYIDCPRLTSTFTAPLARFLLFFSPIFISSRAIGLNIYALGPSE